MAETTAPTTPPDPGASGVPGGRDGAGAPTAAAPTSLTRHALRYFNANLLSIGAGFISFPIVVRLLSREDYGILGYFELFPLIWVALLKMGTQQSIQRFYPVHCIARTDAESRRRFFSSFVLGPMLVSSLLCAVSVAALGLLMTVWTVPHAPYLFIVLILGQIEVVRSLIDNTARARELSTFSTRVAIFSRLLQLVLVLVTVAWIWRTALGVFCANIAGGLVVLAILLRWARRECPWTLASFDPRLLGESLAFGLPLAVSEIAMILLAFADRLMLKHYLGDFEVVGIYTVGYALAMYIGVLLRDSLLPAFQPIANRLYETEGLAGVRALQRRILRLLLYGFAGFVVGALWVGPDVLALAAGEDKLAGGAGPVFQWVAINYVLMAIFSVAAYGLTLQRRTKAISATVVAALGVNLALNCYLIPRYGLMGAAAATLAAYMLMGALQMALCPRAYRPSLRTADYMRPLALAGLFAAVAWIVPPGPTGAHLTRLLVMLALFAIVYVAPAIALDAELRAELRAKWSARRRQA